MILIFILVFEVMCSKRVGLSLLSPQCIQIDNYSAVIYSTATLKNENKMLCYTAFFFLIESHTQVPILVLGFSVHSFRIFNLVLYYHLENNSTIEIIKPVRYCIHI